VCFDGFGLHLTSEEVSLPIVDSVAPKAINQYVYGHEPACGRRNRLPGTASASLSSGEGIPEMVSTTFVLTMDRVKASSWP